MSETSTTPTPLAALIAQREKLDAMIRDEQELNKAENVRKVRAFIANNGLTIDDVFPGASKSPKASASKKARTTLPIKFRDPANPAHTWTGRGFKPKWLVAALAAGATIESFAVGAAPAQQPAAVEPKSAAKKGKATAPKKSTKVEPPAEEF